MGCGRRSGLVRRQYTLNLILSFEYTLYYTLITLLKHPSRHVGLVPLHDRL